MTTTAPASTRIPKVIHQIWIQGREALPFRYRKQMLSWQRHNPAWRYRLWDGETIARLLTRRYPHLLGVYETYESPVARSDIGRYVVLDAWGGVYADMDTVCIRPLDDYLQCSGISLYSTIYDNPMCPVDPANPKGLISNALIASAPAHDIWASVFEEMATNASPYTHWIMVTGPETFGRAVLDRYERGLDDVELLTRDKVVTAFYMSRRSLRRYGLRNRDVFAIHFNDSARVSRMARLLRLSR